MGMAIILFQRKRYLSFKSTINFVVYLLPKPSAPVERVFSLMNNSWSDKWLG